MEKVILYIKGMDCEDEAKILRAKLSGLKGIRSFDINIMARNLNAAFDEDIITGQDIIKAIDETGMKEKEV